MKVISLGSGSKGNCFVAVSHVDGKRSAVMFDCGFGIRIIHRRLARAKLVPEDLSAIFVTHEHGDHAKGIVPLAKRYGIPVWMSYGTFMGIQQDFADVDLNICKDGDCIAVGSVKVTAFSTSHDVSEPLQYHVTDGVFKAGMLTDTGCVTKHIKKHLDGCHVLFLECNYDEEMLRYSDYPVDIKRRIRGIHGHLSNDDAAAFLMDVDSSCLKAVVASHISQNNNAPELARKAMEEVAHPHCIQVIVADQEMGTDWIEL